MPTYSEIYVNETSAQRFCTDCGVLVVDDKAHDRFHESLETPYDPPGGYRKRHTGAN